MEKEELIIQFSELIYDSNTVTFPIVVDSFTNYWNYEFGSLDDLPKEIDQIIAEKAIKLGLLE